MLGKKPLGVWLTVALALVAFMGLPATANALIPATASVSANPSVVSFGAVVPLNISVTANDDVGTASEYWIVVTDPALNKYSFNGTSWVSGLSTFGAGPLADFANVVNTSPLTAAGTYKVEILVDFTVNGTMDSSLVYDYVNVTVNSAPQTAPTLRVTVNGFDNPTVTIGDTTALRLQMNSGTYTGTLAEWWIIITRPDGGKWYYDSLGAWQLDPVGAPLTPTAYGWNPVIDVDTVVVSPNLTLPGQYTVYWGMDDTYDGSVGLVVWDTATIQVPGNLPSVGISFAAFGPGVTNPSMWPGTGGAPLLADLNITVYDGDYGSTPGEIWFVCIKPDGSLLYHDPDWLGGPAVPSWGVATYRDQNTLTALEALWDTYSATSPNMDAYGTWSYYILIDGDQNGAIDTDYYIYDRVQFYVGTDPLVDIYPYTSPWSISTNCNLPAPCASPEPLGVWAYVYPGLYGASLADFWVCAVSPVGVYSSLKNVDGWVTGIDYFTQDIVDNVKTGVVGPAPDPDDPAASHENWNYLDLDLEAKLNTMTGTWTVYFGLDTLNGYVDSNIIYDTQTIVIQP